MKDRVALYLGRRGPGFTPTEDRIVNARARFAIETAHARWSDRSVCRRVPPDAAIHRQPLQGAAAAAAATRNASTSRLSSGWTFRCHRSSPSATSSIEFLFSAVGQDYNQLKEKASKQDALPKVDLKDASVRINIDSDYEVVQTRLTRNVVGIIEGTDARLRDTYVMLGAHYDHVGYQQFAGTVAAGVNAIASCPGQSRPSTRPGDIINNGADDDGSGTVALMAHREGVRDRTTAEAIAAVRLAHGRRGGAVRLTLHGRLSGGAARQGRRAAEHRHGRPQSV